MVEQLNETTTTQILSSSSHKDQEQHPLKENELCFIKLKSSLGGSITLSFRLFVDKLPKTTGNFIDLLVGTPLNAQQSQSQSQLQSLPLISYKKSKVTRVIVPEYLIQLGQITKRSNDTLAKFNGFEFIDNFEYLENIKNQKFDKKGLLCLVDNPNNPVDDKKSKFEFFITLVDRPYDELKDYLIIGELSSVSSIGNSSSIRKLNKFFSDLEVDDDDLLIDGLDCFIDRCGVLIPDQLEAKKDGEKVKIKNKDLGEKINAFDALYGSTKSRKTKKLRFK